MDSIRYNEDYFEHGIEKHISGYSNYRWIPELTIPMAMSIIDYLKIGRNQSILDFGCAKGFMTKAFRLLGRDAWGCDISEYAISKCDKEMEPFCRHSNGSIIPFVYRQFDWIISKDVFEHIEYEQIPLVLHALKEVSENAFLIIPLGDGKKFTILDYDKDVTHVTPQPVDWWEHVFECCSWKVVNFSYEVHGIKDNWSDYKYGNGFFTLKALK